jgi:hypothetical protein
MVEESCRRRKQSEFTYMSYDACTMSQQAKPGKGRNEERAHSALDNILG